MLHIVGGTYFEYCAEPYWSQLYGSGLRAAAAVSTLADEVMLTTYCSLSTETTFQALANTFGFRANAIESSQTFSFAYLHGLSRPTVRPDIRSIAQMAPLNVQDETILRFGMLESEAVVTGRQVVYDPQAGSHAVPFQQNGSSAELLAIVANEQEIRALAGGDSALAIRSALFAGKGADVVLVKRGPQGVSVVTAHDTQVVPAYITNSVWPVGSGDVFSAVFAHYWAEGGISAIEAARNASKATAYYCDSQSLPIPVSAVTTTSYSPAAVQSSDDMMNDYRPSAYLAGPFFTMSQRWLINEAKTSLENLGLKVFSPLHEVGHGLARDVAPADIKALKDCQVVLALVDGLDSGTLFEVGYAKALGIPVVVFAQNEVASDLTMLEGTGCPIFDDFPSAIYNAVWEGWDT